MIISVVACGKTAEGWHNTPCDLSIGVNDCARFGKETDWLVVINRKFPPDREAIIKASKPKMFFTTIPYWQQQFPKAETLRLQQFSKHVKKGHVYSSKTSPFVALSLAFNAGATNVILHGVDLVGHSVIKDKLRDYELRKFEKFCRELAAQGCQVWVSSKDSSLSKFLPFWSIPGRCEHIHREAFNFVYDLDAKPCEEMTNYIKSLKFEPATKKCEGREFILQVEGLYSNKMYDIGEVEVIKNDGRELILRGVNFEATIDLTQHSVEDFIAMKIGDKFKATATHEM
jgi:hypothetical protein